jgi:hypothetical protein
MILPHQLCRDWRRHLDDLVRGSHDEIVVAAPYISREGAEFVTSRMSNAMKVSGQLIVLTDLSPLPICQGSTDPFAVRQLVEEVTSSTIYHLPKLHAKVYVSGTKKAIVTSGNLTGGGLYRNYEYGVCIDDPTAVADVRRDVLDYAALGALVSGPRLIDYCDVALAVRHSFQEQLSGISKRARDHFQKACRAAEDELIKLRLSKGAMHTLFEDAILFFLKRHGPLATPEIHSLIESAYPDLCDNTEDRVINGLRFGKRWKHAVRTAQQHLKKKRLIDFMDRKWCLGVAQSRPV